MSESLDTLTQCIKYIYIYIHILYESKRTISFLLYKGFLYTRALNTYEILNFIETS